MYRLMRSNTFRLAVLLWFAGWLLVVMPGHTRGIVKLPGSDAQASQSSCCDTEPSCCDTALPCQTDGDCPPSPVDPAKHCAICFLKAHLTDAPTLTFYTPFLGELDELSYDAFESIYDDPAVPMHSRGRAPPA